MRYGDVLVILLWGSLESVFFGHACLRRCHCVLHCTVVRVLAGSILLGRFLSLDLNRKMTILNLKASSLCY